MNDTWEYFQTLEVGRTYLNRNGGEVKIIGHTGSVDLPFKSCAERFTSTGRVYGYDDSCRDLLKVKVEPPKSHWTLIEFNEDGDPTNVPANIRVLVPPTKGLGMTVAKWNLFGGWEIETGSGWVSIYAPTHWMELPVTPT